MTITEALAEIKTILKRIQSKREFIQTYQFRVDSLKDPLEKDGGSTKAVSEATQAISDLEQRIVDLRSGISDANTANTIELSGTSKSIADWLIWRREVAPERERFLNTLATRLSTARSNIRGVSQQWGRAPEAADKPTDIVVNMDEAELSQQREAMHSILGQLDGQLSLKNATIQLSI